MSTMTPAQWGKVLAGLTANEIRAALLAIADEIPDEENAAWLRKRANSLSPQIYPSSFSASPRDWYYWAENEASTFHHRIPRKLALRLGGKPVNRTDVIDYNTCEEAWEGLLIALGL